VDWGAELFILNSNITSAQTWYTFEANGNLTIENSLLSRIDGGIRLNLGNYTVANSTFFNNPQYAIICFGGVALYNNSNLSNIVLINNTLHSNYCGLLVSFFEEPLLYNNTFTDNEWGIICQVFGSPYLYSNTISHNLYGGIKGELGYIALYNNTISSNGGYGVKGDHTVIYAYNNSIYDNELWGIYGFNAPIFHDNNTYLKDGLSESQGGLVQEWELLVNVKDADNNTLGNVNITIRDRLGNLVWTGVTIGSVRTPELREYEILNNGTEILREPFTIHATKGEYYCNITYEIEPYEEIIIILEYEEEKEPEEPIKKREIPAWIIAMVAVIWLLAIIFVILGFLLNYLSSRKP
jgi:parallel beta-helix repeat protein